MTNAQLKAAVAQLVATIKAAAADDAETSVLLLKAKQDLDRAWSDANGIAAESQALLVLEARAAGGKTVEQQKSDAALVLKKHPSAVTALEVVNLKLMVENDVAEPVAPGGK